MHLSSKIAVLLLALFCASANAADCSVTSTGDIPLYPSIFVPRTADEESAGQAAVNSIPPGPTVLLSIGMSNAKGIWDVFIDDADSDPLKDPDLEVVNGAQAGGAVESWAEANLDKTWGELDESLGNAGVAKRDVSVIWFMLANSVGSTNTPEAYSADLESDTRDALDLFAIEFPNLKVVWLQPMIYAGYSTASGNYEPYAYETGRVAQRVLVDQNWPFFVGYGPYLWADGVVPRDDGLTWLCTDFKPDGNHPGPDGQRKHADYLTQFFHEDSVASIGYLDAGALVMVPDVVGLDQSVAESSIVSAGLAVGTVSTANSDTVAADNVISQSPTGGSMVASGTAVDLVVSLGPAQLIAVPDVVNLEQASAEASIVSAGFVVGVVSTANSDSVLAGSVISQSPTGGSMAASSTAVDLVVSLGPFLTVPDVVDLDQATAESLIISAGLVLGVVSNANSDIVVAGNVISQNPTGGSSVATGTAVDVVVSLGPFLTVPDVADLDQVTAESLIISAGLVVGVVSNANSDIVVAGNVIGQDPTGGTLVASGTAVDLVVSLGPALGIPMMLSPADGSTLSGSSETFTWSAEGASVSSWRLKIGSTPGARDIYGKRLDSAVTSELATGLPTDGSIVYVTLGWTIDGVASEASYVYAASGDSPPPAGTPAITSPVPGSVLSGASETFTWSAGGAAVSRWRLEVGTTPDGRDLFVENLDPAVTSTLVSGLPTDGSTVYVNLKWRIGSASSVASYEYTASDGP